MGDSRATMPGGSISRPNRGNGLDAMKERNGMRRPGRSTDRLGTPGGDTPNAAATR
ncbi:hypothetical protein ACN8ZM_24660 [Burkholderia aenigmatica]|uniref:hypothetical protein n=1 Tax=Burkholderia aenigmatica TaxID=2015348 RepID=UPI003B42F8C6